MRRLQLVHDTWYNRSDLDFICVYITSLYTVFAYIVVQQSIFYVSIPSFFVAIFCSLLYVYQWKRYKVMMIIQHKVGIKFPILHKILFLGSLDPVVKWLKAPGIILMTLFFITYFFVLIVVLFF